MSVPPVLPPWAKIQEIPIALMDPPSIAFMKVSGMSENSVIQVNSGSTLNMALASNMAYMVFSPNALPNIRVPAMSNPTFIIR